MVRIIQSRIAVPGTPGASGATGIITSVTNTSSIDMFLTGTVLSAGAKFGTTAGTVAQGDDVASRVPTSTYTADQLTQGVINLSKADKSWFVSDRVVTDISTTSTTGVVVSALSFSIGANEEWSADYLLQTACNNTGGVTFKVSRPSGVSLVMAEGVGASTTTTVRSVVFTGFTAAFNTANFANGIVRVGFSIKNGATAGAIEITMAAGTSGQTASVYAGSYVTARRIS